LNSVTSSITIPHSIQMNLDRNHTLHSLKKMICCSQTMFYSSNILTGQVKLLALVRMPSKS
jgi:hypothetical protein